VTRRDVTVDVAAGLVLLVFGACVVLSNDFDWDIFLSFNEVDRRAWLLDQRAPLWSYQLCAGVTRIGDPQAFGLSPLFVLVLLFGSFWGTKLSVLASAGAGVYFTARLLALFAAPDARAALPRASLLTLAVLFVTSNFFLWHLLVGHFTFVSFFFGLGILCFTLEGALRGLGRKQFLIGSLAAWQHYSGGFFHSTVYLLVPFFLVLSPFAAVAVARGKLPWRNLRDAIAFHACGLLLASYKLIAVWQHQQAYPRSLAPAFERSDLGQLLAYQLLPTRGPEWLIPLARSAPWDLHEYSAFSLLPLAMLCAGLAFSRNRGRSDGAAPRVSRHPLGGFVLVYGFVCALLALGDFSPIAPFPVLNALAFQGAVRVAGRFGVGVTLSLALACALLIRRDGVGRGLGRGACLLLLLLALLNLTTFSWLTGLGRTRQLASLPYRAEREMTELRFLPQREPRVGRELERKSTSSMYATLRSGVGVINCYNELPRVEPLGGWPSGAIQPLIDARFGSPGPACVEQSFYTQNEIHLAASCPPFVCLNLGDSNPRDPTARVGYLASRGRICRTRER
jgi:hypothetical protein